MYQKIHKISNFFLISQSIFRQFIISAEQEYFLEGWTKQIRKPLAQLFFGKKKTFCKQQAGSQEATTLTTFYGSLWVWFIAGWLCDYIYSTSNSVKLNEKFTTDFSIWRKVSTLLYLLQSLHMLFICSHMQLRWIGERCFCTRNVWCLSDFLNDSILVTCDCLELSVKFFFNQSTFSTSLSL